jgi:polar amino acid transport system substrate-binding protein
MKKQPALLASLILVVAGLALAACSTTPTATPVPPTATPLLTPTVTPTPPTPLPRPTTFPLKVGADATFRPMEYKDEKSGQIVGLDIDLCNAICTEIGCTATYANIAFDGLLAALKAERIDLVASSVIITAERQKQYLFSAPYLLAGQIVTVRADEKAITGPDTIGRGKKIGVQLGTTGEEQAKKIAQKSGAEVKSYDDVTLAFADLTAGRLDAVIYDFPVTADYIAATPNARLKMAGKVFTEEYYGFVFRQDQQALVEKVNAALQKLKDSGQLAELQKKWGLAQ